jgi:hypothetical protein
LIVGFAKFFAKRSLSNLDLTSKVGSSSSSDVSARAFPCHARRAEGSNMPRMMAFNANSLLNLAKILMENTAVFIRESPQYPEFTKDSGINPEPKDRS